MSAGASVRIGSSKDWHRRRRSELLGEEAEHYRAEIELVRGASATFDAQTYQAGRQTPVFFGSALNNFGIEELLRAFVRYAPSPLPRATRERQVEATEPALTGFVFKIQANMDPGHRDRIAFVRLCSGRYQRGMRLMHVRLGKQMKVADALTFMAADRARAEEAYAGDIIGLHNHGTINIGDSFSEGEPLHFTGIPNFAPEIFQRAVLKDPLRMKALSKGLDQLCEEGATQLFRPLRKQRPDPRGRRPTAVRGRGVSAAGRVRRAVCLRERLDLYRALGQRAR